MDNNQGGGNRTVYIAIIVALLLINFGAVYLLVKEHRAKDDVTAQKENLQGDFKKLSDTLDSKKMELDQFRGKNAELDSVIDAQQQAIDKQKRRFRAWLVK